MTDDTQNKIIQRFLDKSATEEEVAILLDWLRESESNKKIFDVYNEIWHITGTHSKMPVFNVDTNWNKLDQEISSGSTVQNTSLIKTRWLVALKVAAVMTLLLSLSFSYLFFKEFSTRSLQQNWVKMEAPAGEKAKMYLEDGTLIWLNSGSVVEYCVTGNKRMAKLNGEGYFHVAKNRNLPFVVNAGGIEIKVLGTKFNVSAYERDDMVKTTLSEGSVSIKTTEEEVVLIPGQQALVKKGSNQILVDKVDPEVTFIWQKEKLQFRNASFEEVIRKLESWYHVSFTVDDHLLQAERFTMTIKNESLTQVLERMKITTELDYKINGNQVEIKANIK